MTPLPSPPATRHAAPTPVFDGHNDTLLDLLAREGTPDERSFFRRSGEGHLDLPRAREGGFSGGFFSVFVPALEPPTLEGEEAGAVKEPVGRATSVGWRPDPAASHGAGPMNVAFPPLDPRHAAAFAERLVERLFRLEDEAAGALRVVRSAAEAAACIEEGWVGAVLHFEGAEPLDPGLGALERWHERGLRSLGITWSRENAFGHGVPFRYPASPDTGPGLTEAGKRLVRRCGELGILVDLAHLNERGFFDVAAVSERPLVVTHAAAHALCPATRNLTDAQLDAVAASAGVVGVVFAVAFLRADGVEDVDTPLDRIADHILHMVGRMGAAHVALGSDFDGTRVPAPLGDVAGLPRLLEILRARGLSDEDVERIAWRNWLRVLRACWS